LGFLACGYHVAGTTSTLPNSVKVIAVPAFGNVTTRPRLANLMAGAITREFISRTHYQIVADPKQADSVLTGSVVRLDSYPTTFDPSTGRASGVQIIVTVQVALRERATNAVILERPRMEFRQNYEISVDPRAYFDESDVALDRLSRDLARSVVSLVLDSL
jgi:hypothetical protein